MFDIFALFFAFSVVLAWVWPNLFRSRVVSLWAMGLILTAILLSSVYVSRQRGVDFCRFPNELISLKEIDGQKINTISQLQKILGESQTGKKLVWQMSNHVESEPQLSTDVTFLAFLQKRNLSLRCLRPIIFHPPKELMARAESYKRGSLFYSLGGKRFHGVPDGLQEGKFYPAMVLRDGLTESTWVQFPSHLKTKEEYWNFLGLLKPNDPLADFSDELFLEMATSGGFLQSLGGATWILGKQILDPWHRWNLLKSKEIPFSWYETKKVFPLDHGYLLFLWAQLLISVWIMISLRLLVKIKTLMFLPLHGIFCFWLWLGVLA